MYIILLFVITGVYSDQAPNADVILDVTSFMEMFGISV